MFSIVPSSCDDPLLVATDTCDTVTGFKLIEKFKTKNRDVQPAGWVIIILFDIIVLLVLVGHFYDLSFLYKWMLPKKYLE